MPSTLSAVRTSYLTMPYSRIAYSLRLPATSEGHVECLVFRIYRCLKGLEMAGSTRLLFLSAARIQVIGNGKCSLGTVRLVFVDIYLRGNSVNYFPWIAFSTLIIAFLCYLWMVR
jgi:hypothetical protein